MYFDFHKAVEGIYFLIKVVIIPKLIQGYKKSDK